MNFIRQTLNLHSAFDKTRKVFSSHIPIQRTITEKQQQSNQINVLIVIEKMALESQSQSLHTLLV